MLVIISSLVTPILLKLLFKKDSNELPLGGPSNETLKEQQPLPLSDG